MAAFDLSLTLSEASALVASRQISPVELTSAFLERCAKLQPALNCFISLDGDHALQDARQAEQEIGQGQIRSALHGLPLALKDLFETKGMLTTHGSRFFADYVPAGDGEVVNRLKAAGSVVLGKTNMHEIALGVTNVNPHYGACHNPWNLERISGGSSGGSATALAADLCLGALGSDTGGSIRIPAGLCGVVGLKPTRGRVSLRGVLPLSWNLDHAGPMARSVRDVAVLLQAIAGYDPLDPYSVNMPVDNYLTGLQAGVRGWRIALASDEFIARADGAILEAVQQAAQVFEHLGAQITEVDLPEGYQAAQTNGFLVTSDGAAYHKDRLETRPQDFGEDVLKRLKSGAARSAIDYSLLRHEQRRITHVYHRFFEPYDLLLLPTTPVSAPFISGPDAIEQAGLLTRFTAPFNLTGLPALSLPCGFTAEGLPLGLQIVAPAWGEASLLRAANAYEQATTWLQRKPDL